MTWKDNDAGEESWEGYYHWAANWQPAPPQPKCRCAVAPQYGTGNDYAKQNKPNLER